MKHPSGAYDHIFISVRHFAGLLIWGVLSDERTGLSITVGLVTIFCCLKFETSLFVASYDSQSHGGGIRPRLHTGGSWPSLCNLSTGHTENTASNSSSVIACVYVAAITYQRPLFTEPLLSNSYCMTAYFIVVAKQWI
jgi:hypothetical protein